MSVIKHAGIASSIGLCMSVLSGMAVADVWVLEPSLTIDQRFDDNYYLIPLGAGSLSATRAIGDLGVSRQSQAYVLRGLVRVDALLTTNTDVGDEDLDSNQILIFDAKRRGVRSRYGINVNFKQDTPSRDIAADISDEESLAEDTGLLVSQSLTSNVARREITLEPSFEYDVSRRMVFDAEASYTAVDHDLPEAQDVIYQRYLDTLQESGEAPLPYDEVTIDDTGFFSSESELDDYHETELELGLRFKLTPIVTLSASAAYSRFNADVLPDSAIQFDESQITRDPDESGISRKPRREAISTTTTFKLGYERFLTPTLQFSVEGGVYTNTFDNSDTFRPDDVIFEGLEQPDVGKTESDGWLANTTLSYDAGATRYEGRFSVDVLPSSAGAQVESNELTGNMRRVLSPRLEVSLRARAFEPDRLGARLADRFARRFISFEPRIQWKYTRNWTLSAAYRYRRQKARIEPESAESNAILLAIKYTPPSEIRDTARANGL